MGCELWLSQRTPPPPSALAVCPSSIVHAIQALEEQNLFFIQNSQETEHALDELKQNFGKVQKAMDAKTQVFHRGNERTQTRINRVYTDGGVALAALFVHQIPVRQKQTRRSAKYSCPLLD